MASVMIGTKVKLFSGREVIVIDIKAELFGIIIDDIKFTGRTEDGEIVSFNTRAIEVIEN